MLRKTMIALATLTFIGEMAASSTGNARMGGRRWFPRRLWRWWFSWGIRWA